jgi:hypothetical protein
MGKGDFPDHFIFFRRAQSLRRSRPSDLIRIHPSLFPPLFQKEGSPKIKIRESMDGPPDLQMEWKSEMESKPLEKQSRMKFEIE